MSFIMVLNDGTTYTDLQGCKILEVPNVWTGEDIELALSVPDALPHWMSVNVIRRFGEEPRAHDYITDPRLLDQLRKVKEHLMAVDGWSKADLDTINEVIARLQ